MTVPAADPNLLFATIAAALSGGGLKYAYDLYKDYRTIPSRSVRRLGDVDASIVTVARARDELEEDNIRIRETLGEERTQWASERKRYEEDRAAWNAERVSLRREILALEQQIRAERAESNARYDALLAQVSALSRHAPLPRNEGGAA